MTKNYHVGVADISFYLTDEDGNIKEDKNGNEIEYHLKDGIRFKPLEYIDIIKIKYIVNGIIWEIKYETNNE